MNTKVTVIDSIMGAGKTSWSIQHINQSEYDKNFLYITPFLDEVNRIIDNTDRDFKQPTYKGGSKLENLNDLLECQYDIASTHELFKRLTDKSKEAIKNGHYTLILDEVLSAIEPYDNIKKDDMKLLRDAGCITVDENGFVIWNKEKHDYDTQYNKIKILAENQSLLYVKDTLLLWRYPPEIFTLFENAYIMTYLFDASILKYYFDLYSIQYEKKSIECKGNSYFLSEYFVPDTTKYLSLINIYSGNLNTNLNSKKQIKQSANYLSSTWFKKSINSSYIKQLKNNLGNYFRNILKAPSNTIMWTSFKDSQSKLSGKGYAKQFNAEQLRNIDSAYGFLACNSRATNKYADCCNLAYCVNIFLNPGVSMFFKEKNIQINEDLYALSEMIQWIWRSRIRKGESINIYIPSIRMRTLLQDWIEMNLDYQKSDVA